MQKKLRQGEKNCARKKTVSQCKRESAQEKMTPQCKRKAPRKKKQRQGVLLCDATRACNSMQNDKKKVGYSGNESNSDGLLGNKWRRQILMRIRWERKTNIFNIFLVCGTCLKR
jgi:hypothetical protein